MTERTVSTVCCVRLSPHITPMHHDGEHCMACHSPLCCCSPRITRSHHGIPMARDVRYTNGSHPSSHTPAHTDSSLIQGTSSPYRASRRRLTASPCCASTCCTGERRAPLHRAYMACGSDRGGPAGVSRHITDSSSFPVKTGEYSTPVYVSIVNGLIFTICYRDL